MCGCFRSIWGIHRRTFSVFWRWSNSAVAHAQLRHHLQTTFGWERHIVREPNPRSLQNHPMQANGAEMLRLACIAATRGGFLPVTWPNIIFLGMKTGYLEGGTFSEAAMDYFSLIDNKIIGL